MLLGVKGQIGHHFHHLTQAAGAAVVSIREWWGISAAKEWKNERMTLSSTLSWGSKRLFALLGTETKTACSAPSSCVALAAQRNSDSLQNIYLRSAVRQDPLIAVQNTGSLVPCLTSAMQIHTVRGALGWVCGDGIHTVGTLFIFWWPSMWLQSMFWTLFFLKFVESNTCC